MSRKVAIREDGSEGSDQHSPHSADEAGGFRSPADTPIPMRRRDHHHGEEGVRRAQLASAGGAGRRSTDQHGPVPVASYLAELRKLSAWFGLGPGMGPEAESEAESEARPKADPDTDSAKGPAAATRRSISFGALLPLAIVIAGSIFAALAAHSPLAIALVTFLTGSLAGLSLLALQARRMDEGARVAGMRERFETLEDRAWELRESEERYRTLAEAFGDLLVLQDADGRIIYGNGAYAGSLGKQPDAIIGQPFERGNLETGNRASVSAPGSHLGGTVMETSIDTPSGRRWFAWLDLPMRDERHGPLILSVARDITPFRQAEAVLEEARGRAEQASIAKSRFLAMVSHEMRTPLNGILGISRLLRGTGLNAEQENYNNAVIASGEALLGLIGDMLDLTMIEAGRFALREEPFRLRDTLDAVSELLAPRAHEKNIGLGLFVDPSLPDRLIGDAGRLRQILINLAGNAIKYTEEGGVAIRVNPAGSAPPGKASLQIEVCDTGPGLCDADRERIFAEFERSDDAATRRTDGAGLGLAISRAIAVQMGGSIALVETGPRGSVFRLDLSLGKHADREDPAQASAKPHFAGRAVLAFTRPMEADCLALQLHARCEQFTKLASSGSARRWLANPPRPPRRTGPGMGGLVIADAAHLIELEEKGVKPLSLLRKAGWQVVVLLKPDERHRLEAWRSAGASAWLMRPVREDSLNEVLRTLAEEPARPGLPVEPDAPINDIPAPPSLPLAAPETKSTAIHSPDGRTRPPAIEAGEALTILLAEDNDINALLVTAALGAGGVEVERAADGAAAVKLYQEAVARGEPHRVILMDLHMPVMDGDTATRNIRAFEREQKLPEASIIALTADEQGASRQQAIAAGVNAFQVKPVDPEGLLRMVLEHAASHAERATPPRTGLRHNG